MTPTQETISIANYISTHNPSDRFMYCIRLKCWLFESKCKKKHDRVVKLWKKGNKHPEIDVSCLMCNKYKSDLIVTFKCSGCGVKLTKENSTIKDEYYNYVFANSRDRYCRKCRDMRDNESKERSSKIRYVNIDGETKSLYEWSKVYGIKIATLCKRINDYGWDEVEAVTTPVRKSSQNR